VPSDEAESSSQLRVLLATDLAACFYQEIHFGATTRRVYRRSSFVCTNDLFHPTANLIVDRKSISMHAPFVGDAVSHLRASLGGAILHALAPDNFRGNCCYPGFLDILSAVLGDYLAQGCKHGSPGFHNIGRVLRKLQLDQEELYKQLERSLFLDVERKSDVWWRT
jgi:hypothetical protein